MENSFSPENTPFEFIYIVSVSGCVCIVPPKIAQQNCTEMTKVKWTNKKCLDNIHNKKKNEKNGTQAKMVGAEKRRQYSHSSTPNRTEPWKKKTMKMKQ